MAGAAEWVLVDAVAPDFACHRPQGTDRASVPGGDRLLVLEAALRG
ncbi:hypothetical protein [Streptomyces sp. NPDC090080]